MWNKDAFRVCNNIGLGENKHVERAGCACSYNELGHFINFVLFYLSDV